jgi:bacterioferritin
MQGHDRVIEALNAGLTIELTAINQYFIHSKMCRNWGLNKLADHYYAESIEEMKHADEVIDRVLFLDGVPEIARYDVIKVGQTPKEQIENNMTLEIKGVATYNGGIQTCIELKDSGSRELMERMVVESEDSVDWAEAQLDLIKMAGLENYLAQQIGDPPAAG